MPRRRSHHSEIVQIVQKQHPQGEFGSEAHLCQISKLRLAMVRFSFSNLRFYFDVTCDIPVENCLFRLQLCEFSDDKKPEGYGKSRERDGQYHHTKGGGGLGLIFLLGLGVALPSPSFVELRLPCSDSKRPAQTPRRKAQPEEPPPKPRGERTGGGERQHHPQGGGGDATPRRRGEGKRLSHQIQELPPKHFMFGLGALPASCKKHFKSWVVLLFLPTVAENHRYLELMSVVGTTSDEFVILHTQAGEVLCFFATEILISNDFFQMPTARSLFPVAFAAEQILFGHSFQNELMLLFQDMGFF